MDEPQHPEICKGETGWDQTRIEFSTKGTVMSEGVKTTLIDRIASN